MGVGNFFGLLPEQMQKASLYGVELDSITGRIAKQLYPDVHITVDGFERVNFADNRFDLAVGNVPFGNYQLADPRYNKEHFFIHDYFFAKTLDKVRPGGIVAFVTSKGTMDKANTAVREYLAQRADLLGAVRLPNNAFSKNAGTEVTSDIIFLQKRETPPQYLPDWVEAGQTADGVPVNKYFEQHPEMVLGTMAWETGMYGQETSCVPLPEADLKEQLEELGVDKLFVDEAHGFKNLFLSTKMRNVAGIGQSEAQKSSDMFAKCRYLDELTGGRGVVFATGTPVSNSMVELYTMMRYLQYDLLKSTGLDHFDSWAAAFGETVTALELAPEGGGFRAKTRFAKFFNLPELMAMWKESADIQTAEMLKLPVPEAENITVVTKPSEFQKELVAELGERAEDVRNRLVEPKEDNMLKITSDGRKLALDQRLAFAELPDDPDSKINACVKNVLQVWQDAEPQKGAQLVFCDLSTPRGDGSFNVYDDIKQKLMAQGVPPEQIAFIHDAKTETQKAELFSKVRKGQVRVLLGSTSKMGAGTNVQKRLAALHHLDCPWRPADIEQREGRILRQGNDFKKVKIFKYVTEGTFDAYNWGLIENKQKFIGQLMSGKNPSRSCEDVDEAALSYAEVKALASGDPRIMEKTELDGQVTKLKLLKANHENQRYALEDKLIKFYPQAIKREQELIAALEADIKHLEAHTPADKEHFSMTVLGQTYTERKEAGQAIIHAIDRLKDLSDKVELGEYRGFPMTLWVSDSGFSQKLQITLKYELSHSLEPGSDPSGNITRIDNALDSMKENLQKHQAELANLLQQTEDAKVEVKRPFPQEAELAEKSNRLNVLNVALNIGGKDAPKDRERQRHDGKTSIKRLLRRMGVESAASASAPKKETDLEVAI